MTIRFRDRAAITGLIADNSRPNAPVSIAAVGFALACYPVAVQRGWMDRGEAVQRCLASLRFFRDSDQSGDENATGFKGFYYHFLDMDTGARVWRSELSMVDTALLIAGALTCAQYFEADRTDEIALRELVDFLYLRIDWDWAQDGADTIWQGWKPECGFLHYGWEGYSEAILLYALALGSPTHPVADCYKAWTATYQWENLYDNDYLYAGPLFVHQFSHAWIDLRGIRDTFMREKDSDYFQNSCRAAYVQRVYARRNPLSFVGFSEDCWGLSSGDGPSDEVPQASNEPRRLFGYAARGVPYGPDDGTLCPSSVLASMPFAPEISLTCMRTMLQRYPEILSDGRLTSGFNPGLVDAHGQVWVSPGHYGLDQGIVALMLENHRSGMIWELMRGCVYIRDGLRRAGFSGGWLDQASAEAS
ncbi:MAG: glucoamylase family protein [Arenimonas sp.]